MTEEAWRAGLLAVLDERFAGVKARMARAAGLNESDSRKLERLLAGEQRKVDAEFVRRLTDALDIPRERLEDMGARLIGLLTDSDESLASRGPLRADFPGQRLLKICVETGGVVREIGYLAVGFVQIAEPPDLTLNFDSP